MKSTFTEHKDCYIFKLVPNGNRLLSDLEGRIIKNKHLNKKIFLSSDLSFEEEYSIKIWKPTVCLNKKIEHVDLFSKGKNLRAFDKKTLSIFLLFFIENKTPFSKFVATLNIGEENHKICAVKPNESVNVFVGKISPETVFSSGNLLPAYIM